ncbi:MAG: hypothetical protein ACRD43_09385, partial [Pyrinomonadaceae bacterium]
MVLLYKPARLRHIQLFVFLIASVFFVSCSASRAGGGNRNGSSNSNSADIETAPAIAISVGKSVGREVPSTIQATGNLIGDEISNVAPK